MKAQACRFRLNKESQIQSGIAILSRFNDLDSVFRVMVLSDTGNQYQNLLPKELDSLCLMQGENSQIDNETANYIRCGFGHPCLMD